MQVDGSLFLGEGFPLESQPTKNKRCQFVFVCVFFSMGILWASELIQPLEVLLPCKNLQTVVSRGFNLVQAGFCPY